MLKKLLKKTAENNVFLKSAVFKTLLRYHVYIDGIHFLIICLPRPMEGMK